MAADKHLHRCRWVMFDAVGTILYPHPSAAETYHRVGAAYGVDISLETIRQRFSLACQREFPNNTSLPTSEQLERDRWRRIIAEVFANTNHIGDGLFEALWNHFAQGAQWRLFDDVAETWRTLRERGYQIGIASNFDQRLRLVCQAFPLFEGVPIYCSAEIGFAKPDPRFFTAVESATASTGSSILHIGDHPECDFTGATNVGWQALWLVRDATSPRGATTIHSLREVVDRLE